MVERTQPGRVELTFQGWASIDGATLGPAPWFRVSGNRIRQGPDGTVAAELRNHQWVVREQHFTRFDCKGRVQIRFEDAAGDSTGSFGPYGAIWVADGALYADERLLAKFHEETQLWHCLPTENFWPVVVLEPAPAP